MFNKNRVRGNFMVEKWKAQEIVEYLEEQLSNSLFHENPEATENGYRCAINDIKEKYINI